MPITITKQFRFEAAHVLPDHKGKCQNHHGHSYVLEVTVTGPIQSAGSERGMILDFGRLTTIWKTYLEPSLDHEFLNESIPDVYPTAENLAGWLFRMFARYVEPQDEEDEDSFCSVVSVELWETASGSAKVTRDA